jgi:F-type H+-transporting ATPase subunit b
MRSWLCILVFVVAVGLVALPQAAARADEGHGEKAGHTEKSGQGEGGHGANKDDGVFGKALDLGIWTLVVFLILLMVLKSFAWGPMMEGLKKREENIRAAIDDAAKAREEAQKMREQLQAEIAKAREEQRKIVDDAHKAAERLGEEMKAEAQKQIAAERERLRRELHFETDQALQRLFQQVATVATQVSSKAIQRNLSEEDHRRLVDEALKELGNASNGHKG